jgi:hypothetical protein
MKKQTKIVRTNMLEDRVEIANEVIYREKFGMASIHDTNKTFTGNVLYKSEIRTAPGGYSYDDSVETKFGDTAQVDGLTVWKSNGEVPFCDMLLDFVDLGFITFEQAEFSAIQKNKDASASLKTLYRAEDGNVYLGEDALGYRDERLAKIAEAA